MTTRSKILTLVLVLAPLLVVGQQKMQFTQYMFSGLAINPAYAGADEALSLTFIHRAQWAGVDNAPTTQTFSGHTLFKKKHFGLGMTIVNDKLGVHRNLNAITNYAYHLRVGKQSYLSMGIQAGITNQKSDYGSLVPASNNDPKVSNSILSETYFNVGSGVYFRSPKLHLGVSVPELIPRELNVNDTTMVQVSQRNLFVFAKYRVAVHESIDLEPSMLIKHIGGVPLSYDVNLNAIFRKVLTTGFSYRRKESVDFLLKAQITPQLQLGYAYDHPIGVIARISNGSHEAMVQYLFRYERKKLASPR